MPQAFGHGIDDGVAVQHGNQRRVSPQRQSGLRTPIEPQTKRFRQKKQHPGNRQGVQKRRFQAPTDKVANPAFVAPGGAPGKFRDEKLRQAKKNTGRKHENGKGHAADNPEAGQGIGNDRVSSQSLGYHQVFGGADTGFQYVCRRQRQGNPTQPLPNPGSRSGCRVFFLPQNHQAAQGQTAAQTAA